MTAWTSRSTPTSLPCRECEGTGVTGARPCFHCLGTGRQRCEDGRQGYGVVGYCARDAVRVSPQGFAYCADPEHRDAVSSGW